MTETELEALRIRYDPSPWSDNDHDEQVIALIKAYQEAIKERDRLIDEAKRPTCNDCGVELGDNWCAKCAGKAAQYRLVVAEGALAEINTIVTAFLARRKLNS